MRKSAVSTQSQLTEVPVDVYLGRAAMMGFMLVFGAYLALDALAPGAI